MYHRDAYDRTLHPQSRWRDTAPPLGVETPALEGERNVDFAIVGGGYAGLSAALALAGQHGANVAVLEAGEIGWGASGRNGGFCCAGSSKLTWPQIIARFGLEEAKGFHRLQKQSIEHVRNFLDTHAMEAHAAEGGEVELAHRPSRVAGFHHHRDFMLATFGERFEVLDKAELKARGLDSPAFHGGLLSPDTFGLQPLAYVRGLADASVRAGAAVHGGSRVVSWQHEQGRHVLRTKSGVVRARKLLLAMNGYVDEAVFPVLGGVSLPALSRILVTRKLREDELAAQGWTSTLPAYDSRNLLHYFRLLPDGCFMFGGRGGLDASAAGMNRSIESLRRIFDACFPAWRNVETANAWGGLVCLTRSMTPFCGQLEGAPNLFAAFGWHGNGVAMASLCGDRIAGMMARGTSANGDIPSMLQGQPKRFPPLVPRIALLAAAYAAFAVSDAL